MTTITTSQYTDFKESLRVAKRYLLQDNIAMCAEVLYYLQERNIDAACTALRLITRTSSADECFKAITDSLRKLPIPTDKVDHSYKYVVRDHYTITVDTEYTFRANTLRGAKSKATRRHDILSQTGVGRLYVWSVEIGAWIPVAAKGYEGWSNYTKLTVVEDVVEDFTKVVRVGKVQGEGHTYCKVEWKDSKLSITGVVAPRKSGDAITCGQVNEYLWSAMKNNEIEYAPEWNSSMMEQFLLAWADYHLNDMQAGSPKQTAFVEATRNASPAPYNYSNMCELLKEVDLYIDKSYLHNGKPYKYGSAWLTIPVPFVVVDMLSKLPDTDRVPAWV